MSARSIASIQPKTKPKNSRKKTSSTSILKNASTVARANWFARATVDAFFRIDVELVFFLEFFGFVFGWMDAIDRADIDTSGILGIYAGLSNDIGHLFLLESDSSFSSKSTSASQLNVMMRRAYAISH